MTLLWKWRSEFGTIDRVLWIAAICLSAWTLVCAANYPIADAQESGSRHGITSTEIASAMESRQLPTKDARISLAAPITALSQHPQLEIQSMQLVSAHEIRLRVGCRNRAECLSFFATATYPESVNPGVVETKLEVPEHTKPAIKADKQSADVLREAVLRSGSPVLLEMDGERVHILLQVICLESGSAGDRIRVSTRDHKQQYVAEIVTSTLVKGSL